MKITQSINTIESKRFGCYKLKYETFLNRCLDLLIGIFTQKLVLIFLFYKNCLESVGFFFIFEILFSYS